MKTIVAGNSNVTKILGKQRIKDTEYRLMKYVLEADCKNGILLCNTISGQMVFLDDGEKGILDRSFSAKDESTEALIKDYFLVPSDYDEKDMVEKVRTLLSHVLAPEGINNYVIFTTTKCNARCYYCFESEYSRVDMSKEMGDRVIEYIIAHKGREPITLSWFGGEPLVGINRIDQICRGLQAHNVKYCSDMTSNGFLFTEEIINRAVCEWNLKYVQITLDGTEEVYNQTKAYVSSSENPYLRVLNNIKMLLENGVHVQIRLNLTDDNADNIEELIEELRQHFGNYKHAYVYVHVVIKDLGYKPIQRGLEEENALFSKQVDIDKHLSEIGLAKHRVELPSLKLKSCMADNENAIAIYPNGDLYKCQHFDESEKVGSIASSVFDNQMLSVFRQKLEGEECYCCPLYPSCILLSKCPGREKPNRILCNYDIVTKKQNMVKKYSEKCSEKSNGELDKIC